MPKLGNNLLKKILTIFAGIAVNTAYLMDNALVLGDDFQKLIFFHTANW